MKTEDEQGPCDIEDSTPNRITDNELPNGTLRR